mmetsp:Transcript_25513/g.54708  ORF Transcript_25513/g.54708 Transcript_25513/m.54708 type:complete len:265 (+) Transcript_25513:174-968(+)
MRCTKVVPFLSVWFTMARILFGVFRDISRVSTSPPMPSRTLSQDSPKNFPGLDSSSDWRASKISSLPTTGAGRPNSPASDWDPKRMTALEGVKPSSFITRDASLPETICASAAAGDPGLPPRYADRSALPHLSTDKFKGTASVAVLLSDLATDWAKADKRSTVLDATLSRTTRFMPGPCTTISPSVSSSVAASETVTLRTARALGSFALPLAPPPALRSPPLPSTSLGPVHSPSLLLATPSDSTGTGGPTASSLSSSPPMMKML